MLDLNDCKEYEYQTDGPSKEKSVQDDPCTIEFGSLDMIPTVEKVTADEKRRYLYPECGNRVKDLTIPFKGVGMMTVKLQCMNELYGVLREDQPIRYDVSRALWHRCPPRYVLCYTPKEHRLFSAQEDLSTTFSYYGYDDMGTLPPLGEQVISILTNPDVSADQAVKAFKALNLQVGGKLVKVFGSGWMLDNMTLDLYQLLASNGLVQ